MGGPVQDPGTAGAGEPSVLADRFELQELLGSGGMAAVYRAWDRAAGRPCALKILGDLLSRDPEFRHRFRREAEAATGLTHSRIVAVYDWGESRPHPFIAMEHVAGGTLRDLLRRRGPLPEADALRIASEVADALAYAHGRDVIHRDIKPHNILLTGDGHVKVADFGIARTLDATNLTRTGTVMGSAHYISPEQARGDPAGPASDQYALGVVLYEMLAGQVPFTGEAPVAIALKHVHEPPPDLRRLRPDLSPAAAAVVERLLAKDPGRRYPSATYLAADLRRLVAEIRAARAGAPQAGAGETAILPRPPRGDDDTHVPRGPDGCDILRAPADAQATMRLPTMPAGLPGVTAVLPVVPAAIADTARIPAVPSPRVLGPVSTRIAFSGVVALLAVVLAAAAYRTTWLATHAAVPSLIGRSVAAAGQAVGPLQLGVVVTAQRQDLRAAVGVILSQDPPPGRQVLRGAVIRLTVSQGSGIVPSLRGVPVSQAIKQLETVGLRLGRVNYTLDDQAASEAVIYQFQAPGTRLAPNGAVDVLVSQGAPLFPLSLPWFGPGRAHGGQGGQGDHGDHGK